MLKLQKLRAQFANPIPKNSPKHIRVSFQNFVKGTKKPGKIVGSKSIQWEDPILLPIKFNKTFYFELYDKHEFGYNPQQLNKVVHGKLSIQLKDNKGTWAIFNYNEESIGYLSATIKSKMPNMIAEVPQQTEEQGKNVIKIKSIVGHFPFARFKKAYIKINIGGKVHKTSQIKSRKGEIVCIEEMKIEKSTKETDAKIQVYSIEDEKQTLIGEGMFYMIGKKPPKKVMMNKDDLQEIGQVFVESKILNLKNKPISFLQNSSKSLKLDESVNISQVNESISIDYDYEDIVNSRVSRLTKDKKQLSVLNKNSNISFTREERFKNYGQRKNDRITYLQQKNMEFKASNEKKHYRGASFGFGEKEYYSKQRKNGPGVGRYKLPSIWDRY